MQLTGCWDRERPGDERSAKHWWLIMKPVTLWWELMPDYDPVQKISIIPRGRAGGLTWFTPSEDRMDSGLYSRSYLENQMAVALGGRITEELIFGEEEATGASNDLQQVARVARQMVTRFGMSDRLGL